MFYISRICIEHIRGFHKLDLDLVGPEGKSNSERHLARKRTVVIGRNGTCKTTLLRCIAIGLSDQQDASGLVAEPIGPLVTGNHKNASIEVVLLDTSKKPRKVEVTTSLSTENGQNIIKEQTMTIDGRRSSAKSCAAIRKKIFVCGYGVGRSTEGTQPFRTYRIIDSAYSLFNYEQTLTEAELTLRRLRDYVGTEKYEQKLLGIQTVLGLGSGHHIDTPKGGGVMIHGPNLGEGIPLQAWADGYRLTFIWLLDLYAWAMRADCITPSGGVNGIVLIDEIEQHLHPAMQTDMLDRLSTLLPHLQIITATHSPLVALGVSHLELVALKRKGNQVQIEENVPDTAGYSAEDVLLDPSIFDVATVYKPELNKKLSEYRELASIAAKKRTRSQKMKLKSLTRELLSQQIPEVQQNGMSEELKKLLRKYANQ